VDCWCGTAIRSCEKDPLKNSNRLEPISGRLVPKARDLFESAALRSGA
jgi:hypothetical protein